MDPAPAATTAGAAGIMVPAAITDEAADRVPATDKVPAMGRDRLLRPTLGDMAESMEMGPTKNFHSRRPPSDVDLCSCGNFSGSCAPFGIRTQRLSPLAQMDEHLWQFLLKSRRGRSLRCLT